ncbi:AP-2 complex subunit mu-1 [Strigomonas culicis]|uniref:AP-2 complex subunit mu-1 n=2 Tax=Strigomonas culicis TaxID=28005 RepID=S9UCP7_9TRYP|nr:AP-2 complex subunit mu-1 [Strigomonas culicis]EPY28577.1 AP-2 complex subunit mu-1 [Strigomonas culicis]|eukprot:EPY27226.1 AP-2 complex subunit mu-1 [Strigomonas culicis]
MIGALLLLNSRGDVILSRTFREGYSVRVLAESFRNEMIATKKHARSPINIINHLCYIHMDLSDLFLVLVSNANVNCLCAVQFGIRLLQLIVAYFRKIDETTLKQNFVVLQALIDEAVDYGYPQITDSEAFQDFITPSGINENSIKMAPKAEVISKKLTGEVPWRNDGLIYRVNEMFIDVLEDINLLMSPSGEILQSDVIGRIVVNNFLSGMPQCNLILNRRAYGDSNATDSESPIEPVERVSGLNAAKLEDVTFHTCVRLNKFDEAQNISFIPPDGEFTLMSYCAKMDVRPPMSITSVHVQEASKTRIVIEFVLKCNSDEQESTDISVRIPCPTNTASAKPKVSRGKAVYTAKEGCIVWTIPKMRSGEEHSFSCEVIQIAPTNESSVSLWARPLINIKFKCVSKSLTGLHIDELRVHEPVFFYQPNKWIRYTTQAGQYECRI